MSGHTPTPWYHRQAGLTGIYGQPYDWIANSPDRGRHNEIIVSRDACSPANYAFIVRACNAHDALVKALEDARARIAYLGNFGHERHARANEQIFLPKIDAALKLARGET